MEQYSITIVYFAAVLLSLFIVIRFRRFIIEAPQRAVGKRRLTPNTVESIINLLN